MDIREWPWKGKPITNVYAQAALAYTGVVLVFVLAVAVPAAGPLMLLVTIGALLFCGARSICRDIRKEWR